jgi:rubrerythrin
MAAPTPRECLDAAARIELLAGTLYALLADRTRHWPVLAQLFLRLASEEEQHGLRIQTLSRQEFPERWDGDRAGQVSARLDEMQRELERIVADVEGRPDLRDSAEILAIVGEFEHRFAELHAEHLAGLFAPDVQGLFAALAAQDLQHVELLEPAQAG